MTLLAGGAIGARAQSQLVVWGSCQVGECTVPALPPGLTYTAVASGGFQMLALRSDGSAVAWGANDYGQCNVPALPPGLTYVEVAAGGQHGLALRSDGSAVAWGRSDLGQCNVPALPPGLGYVEVAAGWMSSFARRSDGAIVAWGDNSQAQCNVPALPAGLSYSEIAAGYAHVVARRSDGSAVAWGANSFGQCSVPALPPGLSYVEVAAGDHHSAARRSDDTVVAWGSNNYGQCTVPALPPGLSYVQLATGADYTAARRSDGSVAVWGGSPLYGFDAVPALPNGYSFADVAGAGLHLAALVDSGDCNGNGFPDECDLGYLNGDCDGNGLHDDCEIAANPQLDCDSNGILDPCDLAQGAVDCDGNGLIDSCEMAGNPALDLDLDGRLDACPLVCQPYWQPIFASTAGIDGTVRAMTVFDDGTGPALYVAGNFAHAGGVLVNRIAKWDGSAWSSLGGGIAGGSVDALTVYDDGTGPALCAGGTFTSAGGAPASRVAKWNGINWTPIGTGPTVSPTALAACDFGAGPNLYVAGGHSIQRWDGTSWTTIPTWATWYLDDFTHALALYDDGSGLKLYVGGSDDGPDATLHAWNGASWAAVPLPVPTDHFTLALTTYDVGDGRALYVGRDGYNGCVSRWDGTTLTALGTGVQHAGPQSASVAAIQGFDDGSGRALFVAGSFPGAGGIAASNIARWDGANWSALGSGMNGVVNCLCVFDDGDGPALYAGGMFTTAGGAPANHLAKWWIAPGCRHDVICEPGVSGVMACPCANPPTGPGLGCDNGSHTGGAQLRASGGATLSNGSLAFSTSGERPTATSILLQGTGQLVAGVTFGQGVTCVTGTQKRLYLKTATAGSIAAPGPGDLSVLARSTALGDPITPGTHRYYGVYYRDPTPLGGCPATSGFNITQQLDVLWQP